VNTDARTAVTLKTLRRMAREGQPFAALTCYDATTARWLERAGVHVLLVGDTAAEVILGLPSTIHMPLEVSLALTAGVKRGAPHTLVMGDMPFMSYQASEDEAVKNAGRFMTEGLADIVKIEADASFAPLVAKMTRAGIPICAHVGCRPQRAAMTGGYASTGRTAETAKQVVDDAKALAEAGAAMLLAEAVPGEVADTIMEQVPGVPLIGIGAGRGCHGQILVLQDLLGLTTWQPGFASPVAALGEEIEKAGREWVSRVAQRRVTDHRYEMVAAPPGTKANGQPNAK
jgi:3-methyl-2-oxobutanoate hydroxymethyltransferase